MNSMFEISTVEREFSLNETVGIPRRLAEYKRGDSTLFVAITKAAFIVTGRIGAEFIYLFEEGVPLGKALAIVCEKHGAAKEQEIRDVLAKLLVEIETRGFYEHIKAADTAYGHTMLGRLTNRCNLRCTHCLVSSAPDWPTDNELSFSEWCSVVDQYAQFVREHDLRPSKVTFTGGEALARKDALEIAGRAKSLGIRTELFSNAVLITNSRIANSIAAAVDEVQVSLDGATAEVHDHIRGQGAFVRSIRALDLLRDAGVKFRLAMVVMPQNYEDLYVNLVPLVRKLGEGFSIRLSLAVQEGRADASMLYPLLEGEQKLTGLINLLARDGIRTSRPIIANQKTTTCGYAKEITVNSDGLVYSCGPQIHPVGNLKNEQFLSIAARTADKSRRAEIDLVEGCRDCNIRYLCGGTCRLNNISRMGRADLTCCDQAEKERKISQLMFRGSQLVPLLSTAPSLIQPQPGISNVRPQAVAGSRSDFVPLSKLN